MVGSWYNVLCVNGILVIGHVVWLDDMSNFRGAIFRDFHLPNDIHVLLCVTLHSNEECTTPIYELRYVQNCPFTKIESFYSAIAILCKTRTE